MRTVVYFDTEFEGLRAGAGLISIGLVSRSGQTFYRECTDTYSQERCSEFCQSVVLPLLEGGNAQCTYENLRKDLHNWLSSLGPSVVLLCDSWRDLEQLAKLFPEGLPINCSCRSIGLVGKIRRRLVNFGNRIYRLHHLRHHHALDDAHANRLIFSRHAADNVAPPLL